MLLPSFSGFSVLPSLSLTGKHNERENEQEVWKLLFRAFSLYGSGPFSRFYTALWKSKHSVQQAVPVGVTKA